MKLYTSDPDIPYTTTKIQPIRTRSDIDAILARWGITKVGWEFDLDANRVKLEFQFNEKFKEKTINPIVVLEPPRIWNKRNRKREEGINWAVSMRVFYWYIKNSLAMAYATQSEKTIAFLAHIRTPTGDTVKNLIIPRLEELQHLKALPEAKQKVIET